MPLSKKIKVEDIQIEDIFTVHETVSSFTFENLLENISAVSKPNNFWSVSSHSDFILCVKWDSKFSPERQIIIDANLSVKVRYHGIESSFISRTVIESVESLSQIISYVDKCEICPGAKNGMKVLIQFGNSAKKVNFEEDVTLEICLNTISKLFDLNVQRIKLQIFDEEFNAYCDLENIEEIKNLSKIKVIHKLPCAVESIEEVPNTCAVESIEEVPNTCAVESIEEVPNTLPSEDLKNLRRRSWNTSKFSISLNLFSLGSQEELYAAEKKYRCTKKLHKASYKLKKEIIDILSNELASYSLYPTQEMYQTTTGILIKVFPFLRDPIGDGTSCWSIALKYRLQEIRRKAKVDEAKVNAGKLTKNFIKEPDTSNDIRKKGFKKPRKGEVNYIPEMPEGETLETLMAHKEQLLNEFKKREPSKSVIEEKMALTYYIRRQEIVKLLTPFNVFKKKWPMLFSPEMLQKEMIRLVGVDVFPKIILNLKNKALQEVVMKKMNLNDLSEEELLKSLPKLFKENWSFYIEKVVPDPTFLFMEDLIVDECELSPHPIILETSSGWSIIAENVLLLEELDFITSVSCLISIYHIFDINYHPSGQKSMLFLSVALAEIPSAQKLPAKVHNLLSRMKLSNQ